MDWYVDTADAEAVRGLREQFVDYLQRHATPQSDVWAAELAFGELLANTVEHAAGPVWVSVGWSQRQPVLTVHDLGSGFDLTATHLESPDSLRESGRGLFLVNHLADELRVAAKRAGGTRLSVRLPVSRAEETSYDPPRRRAEALPIAGHADSDGYIGREPFLLALAVELAQTLELHHGPAAAEAAVAQVGMDVGGRIEQEYRRARQLVDRLDAQQLAELYIGLKHAIEGDFYAIEVSDDRIVLGSRACPFGDVVKASPSLCRMTSSVFGGIAARNTDGAAVVLEERIAVGDPECRIVVWLRAPPDEAAPLSHHYRAAD
jgi:anti-sigma regulatory factor (Ser/Thr protein kinase)